MLSCEKASTVASTALDRRLTVAEFIGLWLHRAICGPCRIYRKQLLVMRARARQLAQQTTFTEPMDNDAKDRIRARLPQANQQEPS